MCYRRNAPPSQHFRNGAYKLIADFAKDPPINEAIIVCNPVGAPLGADCSGLHGARRSNLASHSVRPKPANLVGEPAVGERLRACRFPLFALKAVEFGSVQRRFDACSARRRLGSGTSC